MYEIRLILPDELPTVTAADGTIVPATDQDLMNMGLFRIEGDLFSCIGAFADGRGQRKPGEELPGRRLSSGYLVHRHVSLPAETKAAVLRATVYRHNDETQSLRHMVNDNSDPERLRARVPALAGSAQPMNAQKARAALEAARGLAAVGEAKQLVVPMNAIRDGDVVEVDMQVPIEFAGERRVRG